MAALEDVVESILDGIVAAITAASEETGGGLDEVRTVVRGDRARPMPTLPAVWVVPQPAQMALAEYGGEESWVMDVSIAALVKGDDPTEASLKAQRLAARARKAALDVGNEDIEGLLDIVSRTFDPHARRSEANRALHWTEATVRVSFTVDE